MVQYSVENDIGTQFQFMIINMYILYQKELFTFSFNLILLYDFLVFITFFLALYKYKVIESMFFNYIQHENHSILHTCTSIYR